jgi:hypothetical protein
MHWSRLLLFLFSKQLQGEEGKAETEQTITDLEIEKETLESKVSLLLIYFC